MMNSTPRPLGKRSTLASAGTRIDGAPASPFLRSLRSLSHRLTDPREPSGSLSPGERMILAPRAKSRALRIGVDARIRTPGSRSPGSAANSVSEHPGTSSAGSNPGDSTHSLPSVALFRQSFADSPDIANAGWLLTAGEARRPQAAQLLVGTN